MSQTKNNETFIGFSGLVLTAALLCAPVLGFAGFVAAITTIYFGLVFTNGASTAAKRKTRQRFNNRR